MSAAAPEQAFLNLPYPVGYALSLSIIRSRGDVVTRIILPRSADPYAMQLCKQGLGREEPVRGANLISGVNLATRFGGGSS